METHWRLDLYSLSPAVFDRWFCVYDFEQTTRCFTRGIPHLGREGQGIDRFERGQGHERECAQHHTFDIPGRYLRDRQGQYQP